MSLLDRLEVPLAQSRASPIAVVSPRVTASSALPAPTTPPPTTSTSSSCSVIRAIASSRAAGDSSATTSSVDLHPVQRALPGLFPACIPIFPLLLTPLGVPALGLVPVGLELVGIGPETGGQARGVRGTQRGRFGPDRPAARNAQNVGLELHAQIVRGDPAVHLQHLQVHAGVLFHRVADVAALVADGFQGGPGQVGVGVEAG